jgi:replication factor C large subunit
MSTARREVLPHLSVMTHHCKNRELTVAMAAKYELEAKHVSFVTGSGEDTNKVQSIVEDAERLREERAVENAGGAFENAHAGETEDSTVPKDEDTADDDSEPAQASLDGSVDDETGDDADDSSGPEDDPDADDDQAGLTDFM